MSVFAIDPGTSDSAWVLFDGRVVDHGIEPNVDLLARLRSMEMAHVEAVVIEQIESFGMAVGREVFETVFWTGRFFERSRGKAQRMARKVVKLHLCQSLRAKDPHIRQALLDRFGGEAARGLKRAPGPLYGIRSHEWSALAIAVTWWDQREVNERMVG